MVIDFRNKAQTNLTAWTKVKLSYLVVSYSKESPATINENSTTKSSLIWATSQYVDLTIAVANKAVLTDAVLLGAYDVGNGCGLYYTDENKWRYGIRCDKNIGDQSVQFDVAVHTYIMGFHYTPDAGTTKNLLAAEVKYKKFTNNVKQYELAFYNHPTAGSSHNKDRADINLAWTASNSYTK